MSLIITRKQDKAAPVTLPTAREPDTSPELKNEFVEICQKDGVVKENIIDLTKVGKLRYLWLSLPEVPCC